MASICVQTHEGKCHIEIISGASEGKLTTDFTSRPYDVVIEKMGAGVRVSCILNPCVNKSLNLSKLQCS